MRASLAGRPAQSYDVRPLETAALVAQSAPAMLASASTLSRRTPASLTGCRLESELLQHHHGRERDRRRDPDGPP